MSSQGKREIRERKREESDDFEEEVPTHRYRVDHEEQNEYQEWRKERSERGRKRRRHRDLEHKRRDIDEL